MPPDSEPIKLMRINLPPWWVWMLWLGLLLVGDCLYRVCGPIVEVLATSSALPTNWTPAKSVLAVDWVEIPEARVPYSGIPYQYSYAASDGCIWVLQTHYVQRGSGSTNPNLIVRVALDGTYLESPVLPGDIDELYFAHGRLWVLNGDASPCVWSLDPNSMTILNTVLLPAHLQVLDSDGQSPEWFLQLRLHQDTIYLCANLRQDSQQYKNAKRLIGELWSLDTGELTWTRQRSLVVEEPTSDQAWFDDDLVWNVALHDDMRFFDGLTGASFADEFDFNPNRGYDLMQSLNPSPNVADPAETLFQPWIKRTMRPPLGLYGGRKLLVMDPYENPMRTRAEEVELALREQVIDRLPQQQMVYRLMNRRREALTVFVDDLRSDSDALIPLESDLQMVQQEELRLGNLGFPAEHLWVSALNPAQCLISDLLHPMPDQPGLEHGLLRFGTLAPGETALDWDFAIVLPPQPAGLEFEIFRIDPIWLSPDVWTVICDIGTKDRQTGHEERHEYLCQFVPPAEFADCRTGWHDY